MAVRHRITNPERWWRPRGLVREWYRVLQAVDATRRRLDPDAEPLPDDTLWQLERDGAATGRAPGEVLVGLLPQAAKDAAR